jgi:aminoglycoside 2''-phosphotransferase
VNLDELGDALEEALPQLGGVKPLKLLDAGFGSIVVETRTGLIFRIARHKRCAAGHEREWRFLRVHGPRLPLPIPLPEWRIAPGAAHLPFGAIGYRGLPGCRASVNLLSESIARQLGAFLSALHAFPTAEAEAAGVLSVDNLRAGWSELRKNVSPALQRLLSPAEVAKMETWWDDLLGDDVLHRFEAVVVHSDLWYGNVLVDDEARRITGVVDFEGAHIGDPAEDFATQLHAGLRFTRDVMAAYRACGGTWDGGMEHRVLRYWELREVYGLQHCIDGGIVEEIDDTVEKLRAGPILSPQDHVLHLAR